MWAGFNMGDGDLKKKIKGKEIIHSDKDLRKACEELRYYVEHPNESSEIMLNKGIYKLKDPEAIQTIKCDGVEIGYKVAPLSPLAIGTMVRKIFIKIPGYKIEEVPKKDRDAIMGAVFDAFIDEQQDVPEIKSTADDAMLITQTFMLVVLTERQPNLVSIAGGFNA
jgi:hypothetical protein